MSKDLAMVTLIILIGFIGMSIIIGMKPIMNKDWIVVPASNRIVVDIPQNTEKRQYEIVITTNVYWNKDFIEILNGDISRGLWDKMKSMFVFRCFNVKSNGYELNFAGGNSGTCGEWLRLTTNGVYERYFNSLDENDKPQRKVSKHGKIYEFLDDPIIKDMFMLETNIYFDHNDNLFKEKTK